MAINERLLRWLEHERADVSLLPHEEVSTAREVASTSHVPARRVAKVVVLRDEAGFHLMVVVPATERVDLRAVHRATGRRGLRLVEEDEMLRLFPDCEAGAMPPFGHLYGMAMLVDDCFVEDAEICFQAGNHHEIVRMRYVDWARLARPFTGGVELHSEPSHADG